MAGERGNAGSQVVVDPQRGYRRLDPSPPETEVNAFYESRYRDLPDDSVRRGMGRAWAAAGVGRNAFAVARART